MDVAEREHLSQDLDSHVRTFRQAGLEEMALFTAMSGHMPAFKRFVEAGGVASGELDQLARSYPDLYHYAGVLTAIATRAQKGTIQVLD